MRLRRKILLANILLVIIPVIVMGTIFYYYFSSFIEQKSSEFYSVSLLETDGKLRYAQNEITSVTNAAVTNQVLQKSLKNPNLSFTYERRQELNSLFINHPQIFAFSIYSNDSVIYEYNASMPMQELQAQPWYASMDEAEGVPVWSGPGENGSSDSAAPYLIHARKIKDYYTLEDIGWLVVYVKPELLETVFWDAATLKRGDILLVNKQGAVVYAKSGEGVGNHVQFPFISEASETTTGYYTADYNGSSSFITYLSSHHANWYLVGITSSKLLHQESLSIRNMVLVLGLFALISALLFDRFFVTRLVAAIISVVNGMKRVEQRGFTPIPEKGESGDETDSLVQGFNRMSKQISELLTQVEQEQARKKEAELQALVAQINPHFIYNSLESINAMAVLQGNKDISKMVVSLGKLLRISISENQELIPLETELEHVRHYLNIQKYRFEDQFDYSIAIPDELKGYLTQKLIVQPLVENALYHAIEPMEEHGHIAIEVTDSQNAICIDIIDNGPGFDEETLLRLYRKTEPQDRKYRDGGVGLRNVQERLLIRFGRPYGVMVCSSEGFGSRIRISIPKIKQHSGEAGGL